jgi:hypothetical protein
MTLKTKMLIASAAMGGLMAVSSNSAKTTTSFATPGTRMLDDQPATGKHDCKGKNDCKGQGGCKTSDNGCKGKNSCKGKGGCSGKDSSFM